MNKSISTALKMLSYKALTSYEMTQRLLKKGCTSEEIREIRECLEGWGYLNDRALVEQYIQARSVRYSRFHIQHSLLQRGISDPMIAEGLEEFYPEEKELENCCTEAKKYWRVEKKRLEKYCEEQIPEKGISRNDRKDEQTYSQAIVKIARKLSRQGYPSSSVKEALRQIQREHQLDIISNLY